MKPKTMTRKQLANAVRKNNVMILKLEKNNLELLRKSYLLCDKKQQYKEQMETLGKGKNKETVLVGRIHWMQTFTDQSTGKKFKLERSQMVKRNGEWI